MSNKTYAYILLGFIIISCLIYVGLMYIAGKAFEGGWYKDDAEIAASDGYTYFLMHESALQDPHTMLVRTKNVDIEESFEILGSACLYNSQLPVIWPVGITKPTEYELFYLKDCDVILIMNNKDVSFVFDIDKQKYFDGYSDIDVSPFILLCKESVLPERDVIGLILHVVDDYHGHLKSQGYLRNQMSDQSITLEYQSDWPKPVDLKEGLSHPNEEVQKLSKWLLEIEEKGISQKSETIEELIDYLHKHENSSDGPTRDYIRKIFEFTGWE